MRRRDSIGAQIGIPGRLLYVFLRIQHRVMTCLFFQNSDSVQKKGPVMGGQHPNGVQVRRPDLLDCLQVIVAVLYEAPGVLAQLEEGEPLHHDVGLHGPPHLLLTGPGHLKPGDQGLHGHRHHHTSDVTTLNSLSDGCQQSQKTTHFHGENILVRGVLLL